MEQWESFLSVLLGGEAVKKVVIITKHQHASGFTAR